MAYKVFSNGNALNASELNTYLMNQSVISFASATARDAALTSPTEGTPIVWLEDSNKHVYYTGSAWADLITPASSGNAIINGAFDIWQRGTSATASSGYGYGADRWAIYASGSGTATITQQTFTPGTAPVSGYEGTYFGRFTSTATQTTFRQPVEDVRTFAGQTVTLSFWMKAASAISLNSRYTQEFGSGGSTAVDTGSTTHSITTSWARYTATVTLPSVSGKTIGAGSSLRVIFDTASINTAVDIWGVQLESGSTATAFKRNASNIQGELAACQRYYIRFAGSTSYNNIGLASASSSTAGNANIQFPVTMRIAPTSVESGGTFYTSQYAGVSQTVTGVTYRADTSQYQGVINLTVSSGLNTNYRYDFVTANTGAGNYIGFSAEL